MKMKRPVQLMRILTLVLLAVIFGLALFLPQLAHASNDSNIRNSLVAGGGGDYEGAVLNGWRICLGLANVFVILILVFLAVVNIAHISFDTYNLKKTLPWLIIGIILANFSLIICRMFVDAASVLTTTFAGDLSNVISQLYTNLGIAQLAGFAAGTGTLVGVGIAVITGGIGAGFIIANLLLILIILLLPFILLAILAFLLYIRIALILFLAMIAPLAFVMLAFPVTQQFFKQWWNWFLKWVFMEPICFFLLWAAAGLGKPGPAGLTIVTFAITLALCCLSLVAPFKLGGAVMAGWGKVGKYLPNMGIGQAKKYGSRKYDKNLAQAKAMFGRTGLGQVMARGRAADELDKRNAELELKGQSAHGENEYRQYRADRAGKRQGVFGPKGQSVEDFETQQEVQSLRLESGTRRRTLDVYYSDRGWQLMQLQGDIASTEKALSKTKEDKQYINAAERTRAYNAIPDSLRQALEARDLAQERISNTREGTAERRAAETEFGTRDRAVGTERTNLATAGVPQAQINRYENVDFMRRVERSRQYAIGNVRIHDDAKDAATSSTPIRTAAQVNAGTYRNGPNGIRAGDNVAFFNGGLTSSAQASVAMETALAEVQKALDNNKTAGTGVRGHVDMMRAAGGNALIQTDQSIQAVLGRMTSVARGDILTHINDQRGRAGLAPIMEAQIDSDILSNVTLNTEQRSHAEFANQYRTEMVNRDASGTFRSGLSGNVSGYS